MAEDTHCGCGNGAWDAWCFTSIWIKISSRLRGVNLKGVTGTNGIHWKDQSNRWVPCVY